MAMNGFGENRPGSDRGFWESIMSEVMLAFKIFILLLLDGFIVATIIIITSGLRELAFRAGLGDNNIVLIILNLSGSIYIILYVFLATVSVIGLFWKEIGWKARGLFK